MANVTSSGGITAPVATTPSTTTSTATAKTSGVTSGLSAPVSKGPAFEDDLAKATEKLQPVPHHGRTKIVAGEREGQYLNTSGNKRDGQAFTMEYHGGRRWHVYGEGAGRVVVAFARPAATAADGTASTDATTKPATTTVPAATDKSSSYKTPAATTTPSTSTTPVTGGGAAADDGTDTGDDKPRAARSTRGTSA